MRGLKINTLYCFSPPVMLATFAIEIGLLIWVLWRYRREAVTKLFAVLLLLLAVFQLAEYNVCEGLLGMDSLMWAKIGYVAITFLPVIGIHALLTIGKRRSPLIVAGLYSAAIAFSGYFLGAGNGLGASVCTGNYVIFEVNPHMNTLFMIYYYGLEILALTLAWQYARKAKQKKIKRALYGLATGYLLLLIPTTTVNIMNPDTIRGIPSIMCGFAVLLALVIAFYVMPQVAKKR